MTSNASNVELPRRAMIAVANTVALLKAEEQVGPVASATKALLALLGSATVAAKQPAPAKQPRQRERLGRPMGLCRITWRASGLEEVLPTNKAAERIGMKYKSLLVNLSRANGCLSRTIDDPITGNPDIVTVERA